MISIDKKFLFIHIPKTGGNSIQTVLKEFSGDQIVIEEGLPEDKEGFEVVNPRYGTRKHSTLCKYYASMDPGLYNQLFKFTVVRNPWDRMVSHYFSPHRGPVQWNRQQFIEIVKFASTLRDYVTVLPLIYWFPHNVLKFVNRAISKVSGRLDIGVDYIARYESLDDDYQTICSKLEIPYSKLPVRNKGNREHYSVYYDEELKKMVQEKFTEEIKLMNYEFEYC